MHARGNLDGMRLAGGADASIPLPERLTLDEPGDLVGGSLRGEMLLRGVRAGLGLAFFGIHGLHRATSDDATLSFAPKRGFGFETELFTGYELLRGPFYGYVDLRLVSGIAQLPFEVSSPTVDVTDTAHYSAIAIGFGPRVGLLVPVGHSLMLDVAGYQHIFGGFEGTTAFVGIGYWENDRHDPFSQRLKRGTMGDF